MHIAAVSGVDMAVDADRASAEFRMTTSKLEAAALIGLSLAAMAGVLLPLVLIASDSISSPQVMLTTLSDHPESAILLAGGVLVALCLLTYPLRAGIARLRSSAHVRMADGIVTVERQGLFGTDRWSAPLAQFCGVTHHIRATLSGARHEIILLHPEPSKDVLLHLANRHPQEGADHYARLLGLSEMQPRMLYSRRRSAPGEGLAKPVELTARAA